MTLVESIDDSIPNIREEYDKISDYLHGLLFYHASFRSISYFHSIPKFTEDSSFEEVMSALKERKPSLVIEMHNELVESLRNVLLDDLKVALELAKPFADRYLQHLESKENNS
jgi:hypothetical protein